jgi:sugar-specific transcriptional regulator TrmB
MLASQDEGVQTLTRLGLTSCQAKVYLALARSGISTVKTISKVSEVTREEIYRIMPRLQNLGLVEKAITVPAMFKAIPIEDGLHILLEQRTREYHELQAKTRELLKNFKGNNRKATLLEEAPQFVLVPETKTLIRRKKAIENTQKSIDGVISWKIMLRWVLYLAEAINKALKRGVKIRVVAEKPKDVNSFPEIIQDFKQNPCFKIRYILTPPSAAVAIYDKKRVRITAATAGSGGSYALWSNDTCLLAIVQDYFEIMWLTAIEDKTKYTKGNDSFSARLLNRNLIV